VVNQEAGKVPGSWHAVSKQWTGREVMDRQWADNGQSAGRHGQSIYLQFTDRALVIMGRQ
jgi:hypothetical protein